MDTAKSLDNYLINWPNKTNIADCSLHLLDEPIDDQGNTVKTIVVSFKSIGINTFNVFVIDRKTKLIRYQFEMNQLWEGQVMGFLLNTSDFIVLNKDGINCIALGNKKAREISDAEGNRRRIHSLGSCNYLKIDESNHLLFAN